MVVVVCIGVVFGGFVIVFKEFIECLVGFLGGFCFSMWLLIF